MRVHNASLLGTACTALVFLCNSSPASQVVAAFTPSTTNNKSSNTQRSSATTSVLGDYEVNSEELFASSTFPIKPDDLIERAKEVLSEKVNIGTADGGVCLADDFTFRAQFVEIKKEGYLNALKNFDLQKSFDIKPNFFGFTVDPMQTNRVWFYSRSVSKQIDTFQNVEPIDKVIKLPPQCFHLDFNEDGLIKEVGFYTADRAQGNTDGLGGAFAYFYAVGKPLPFPEAKPYKPSFRYSMLQKFSKLAEKLQKKEN